MDYGNGSVGPEVKKEEIIVPSTPTMALVQVCVLQ